MGAVAEFSSVLDNVFLTKTKNDAGIYAIRFYIRGKPWIVTIDDYYFYAPDMVSYINSAHYFANMGEDNSLWVPLIEKAWAKLKGNFANSDGGWTQNGIRALTGAPVFTYYVYDVYASYVNTEGQNAGLPGLYENFSNDEVFTLMKAANDLNYILGAGTDGTDTSTGPCGIVAGHAYTLIAAFELKDSSSVVQEQVYMVRNPWNETLYDSTQKWHWTDSNWTSDYISQVPNGVDPTTSYEDGIFFVDKDDF